MANSKKNSTRQKTFSLDFIKQMNGSYSALCGEKDLQVGGGFSVTLVEENYEHYPTKFYTVDGNHYAYCSDKKLYQIKNGSYVLAISNTLTSTPIVFKGIFMGKKQLIVLDQSKIYLLDGTVINCKTPFYPVWAICNDVLFTANASTLYFTKPLDYTNQNQSLELTNYVNLDSRLGKIQTLSEYRDTLFIGCERGVAKFTPKGKTYDYSLEELSVEQFSAKPESMVAFGDKICFLQDDCVCEFHNGKIQKTPYVPNDVKVITPQSNAGKSNNTYLISVMFDLGDIVTLCYNLESKKISFCEPVYTISDNGVAKTFSSEVKKFFEKDTSSTFNFNSKKINLADGKLVKILGVSCECQESIDLDLIGDYGRQKVCLKNLTNKKIGMLTTSLTFIISGEKVNLPLKNLKVKYMVLGE